MANLTTLNTIITDLLNIIRGAEVARTEPISKVQIEMWIHQYRAFLIKRELDKDRLINPDYIQTLDDVSTTINSNGEYVTDIDIPNTVFRNNEDGFTWLGSVEGKEYQYMTEQRSQWNQYRKYTNADPYIYLLNNKLYNNYPNNLRVKGLWENPMEVIRLNNPTADINSKYPIPVNLIPTLKEMILKNELGVEAESPSDDTNDSQHNIN